MREWIIKGGPVMIPILLLSVVALAIVLERVFVLWWIRLDVPRFGEQVLDLLRRGELQSALARCETIKHPLARVFTVGIRSRHLPPAELEKRMEREGEKEIRQLERYLGALFVIVGVEPMLGFFGTITGLIRSFAAWEQLGNDITVSALAAGIYQAMITTAAGLAIAIPYYLAYHLLMAAVKRQAALLNHWGDRFLELLAQTKEQHPA